MMEIDEIFQKLNEKNSSIIQEEGIRIGKKIEHLSVFFQPLESKAVWYNCARILVSKSDSELEFYLAKLFDWIRDLNWPGANLIYSRLLCFKCSSFEKHYQICLKLAKETNDISWEEVLIDFWNEYKNR